MERPVYLRKKDRCEILVDGDWKWATVTRCGLFMGAYDVLVDGHPLPRHVVLHEGNCR